MICEIDRLVLGGEQFGVLFWNASEARAHFWIDSRLFGPLFE